MTVVKAKSLLLITEIKFLCLSHVTMISLAEQIYIKLLFMLLKFALHLITCCSEIQSVLYLSDLIFSCFRHFLSHVTATETLKNIENGTTL